NNFAYVRLHYPRAGLCETPSPAFVVHLVGINLILKEAGATQFLRRHNCGVSHKGAESQDCAITSRMPRRGLSAADRAAYPARNMNVACQPGSSVICASASAVSDAPSWVARSRSTLSTGWL